MWNELPRENRNDYKKMILGFASLSKMFSQKSDTEDGSSPACAPIINSKFQETVFGMTLGARIEDIGNTSYDASIEMSGPDGETARYLVGIKTFGLASGKQKVAQFKGDNSTLSSYAAKAEKNAVNSDGTSLSKKEINAANEEIYVAMATELARLRNNRIRSHRENIKGFSAPAGEDVKVVYHVLMPSPKGADPKIYVGETSYDEINTDNIRIIGCTGARTPANFAFTDGNHEYGFSIADSQLLMDFKNKDIILEEWNVIYAEDAYSIFAEIADRTYEKVKITESYEWPLYDGDGRVELFSGLNSFFGVGSKMTAGQRASAVRNLQERFKDSVDAGLLNDIADMLKHFLMDDARSREAKLGKVRLRQEIMDMAGASGNEEFRDRIKKLVYRPVNEIYIPIPDAKKFHKEHPDFFASGAGKTKEGSSSLLLPPAERSFNLIFEPSGDVLPAYISQDSGKAIESCEKQSFLGLWILRGIFQLAEYEPLTREKMDEIGINGVRLYRTDKDNDVHIEFVWIDS